MAFAGAVNLWIFLGPGGTTYSLTIGIAALAVSALLLTTSVRRLGHRHALRPPAGNESGPTAGMD